MNLLDFDNTRRLTPTPLRVIIGLAYVDLVSRGGYHIKTALERLRRRGFFGKAIDVFDAYVVFEISSSHSHFFKKLKFHTTYMHKYSSLVNLVPRILIHMLFCVL